MHDPSCNMAVNLNFIYLHRNFVNRSFVLFNKKRNSLQVFTLTSEGGGLVTITFKSTCVLSVGSSCSYVFSG